MSDPRDASGDASGHGTTAEQPRFEPEIIPPGQSGPSGARERMFVFTQTSDGMRRARVATPGPFTIVLILLAVALAAGLLLALVIGAALVIIPILAIVLAALIVTAVIRGYWMRLRGGRRRDLQL